MSREAALLVMIGSALALLAVLAWAWSRRVRRDRAHTAPVGEIPAGSTQIARFSGFYVATTRHGEPLERLAVRGLGFRSRVDVTVTDAGVAIDLAGQPRLFVEASRIVDAATSTVAIDRVVERGGLARIDWRIDTVGADTLIVDSFFRLQDAPAHALVDALRQIPTPAFTTGGDA